MSLVVYAGTVVNQYRHELRITLLGQDVATNTSRIHYKYSVQNTGSLANGSWTTLNDVLFVAHVNGVNHPATPNFDFRTTYEQVMVSGEQIISNNPDGTLNIVASLTGAANPGSSQFGAAYAYGTGPVPTIPRASKFILSKNPIIEGEGVGILFTGTDPGWTHLVEWESGSNSGVIATAAVNSTSWTPSSSLFGSANSVAITITVTTKNGSDIIGAPFSRDVIFKRAPVYPEIGVGTPYDIRLRRVIVEGGKLVAKEEIPYVTLTVTDTFSASASCSLTIAPHIYETPLDEAIVVADMYDGSQWLDTGMLMVISRTEGDLTDLTDVVEYSGMSYVDFLLGKNLIAEDYNWEDTAVTTGDVIWQYTTIGKGRGWGPHVSTSFTQTKTSVNTNWANKEKITTSRGTPVAQILDGFVSDARMEYRSHFDPATGKGVLDAYNVGFGADWAIEGAEPIVNLELAALFKVATAAPVRKDAAEKLTRVFVSGDEVNSTRESAANVNPAFGHLEGSANATGVTTVAGLNSLADALLTMNASASVERTFSYDLSSAQTPTQLFPYRTFRPGDWILVPSGSGPIRARVSQVAITRDEDGTTATVTTGDLIPSGLAATARKIAQAGGGAIAGGTQRAPLTLSSAIPAAPTGITTTIDGFWDATGAPKSGIEISWSPVTVSMQGNALTVNLYEVWTRSEIGQPWVLTTISDYPTITVSPLDINATLDIKLRARSQDGVYGVFSDPISVVTLAPTETLPAPSTPFLTADTVGTVSVAWNGLLGGTAPPMWFNYVQAEISDSESGAYSVAGQQLVSAGSITVSDVGEGTWWFRLVGYDTLNVRGAASAGVSILVVPDVADTREPKAPTGVTVGSSGYWSGPTAQSQLEVSWTAVTQATDNSAIDILVYEVWGKLASDTEYKLIGSTQDTSISIDSMPLDSTWSVKVLAIAMNNITGAFSSVVTHTTLSPTFALDEPSAPNLVSRNGIVEVSWDGLLATVPASTPPEWFMQANIEMSDTETGDYGLVGTLLLGQERRVISRLGVGSTWWFRLRAVDKLGRSSDPSLPSQVTVEGINGADLIADTIEGNSLKVGTIEARHFVAGIGQDIDISSNSSVNIIASRIDTVQSDVDGVADVVTEMGTYYQFGVDGAVIGSPGSPFQLVLANDGIEIRESGTRVSRWDAGQMQVTSFVGDKVILGNHQLEKYGNDTVVRRIA